MKVNENEGLNLEQAVQVQAVQVLAVQVPSVQVRCWHELNNRCATSIASIVVSSVM
jgi:hypothetical protein